MRSDFLKARRLAEGPAGGAWAIGPTNPSDERALPATSFIFQALADSTALLAAVFLRELSAQPPLSFQNHSHAFMAFSALPLQRIGKSSANHR